MQTFTPRLDILPEAQQRLWPELRDLPSSFTLYGGTAVALYLGHRQSVDFDFFLAEHFEPLTLYRELPVLVGSQVSQAEPDTLTCILDRDGPVQLSFLGVPFLGRINPVNRTTDTGLAVASLLDLGATKASAVQQRPAAKDYIDMDALLQQGLSLTDILQAARQVHGTAFSPHITLKALAYFGDGDLPSLPEEVRNRLQDAVASVALDAFIREGRPSE
jgi:hypothetical protein